MHARIHTHMCTRIMRTRVTHTRACIYAHTRACAPAILRPNCPLQVIPDLQREFSHSICPSSQPAPVRNNAASGPLRGHLPGRPARLPAWPLDSPAIAWPAWFPPCPPPPLTGRLAKLRVLFFNGVGFPLDCGVLSWVPSG